MNNIELNCGLCGKSYIVGVHNTKMYGIYIESECPYCNNLYNGKIINFLKPQVDDYDEYPNTRVHCAIKMIELIQSIEKEINPKPKRKIKNKKIYVEVEEDKFIEESKVPKDDITDV